MKELQTKSHYEKKFNEELARLNAEQRKAVEHIDGPVMVIAGPGTGKTQIIAARIGHILKSDIQIAPHNILCLTYTDAGTVAMRNRLLQFIGPTAYRVNLYTFHAFCNDIIQHNLDYFGKREMEPISELETVQLLREMLDALPPTHALKRLKGEIYYDVPRIKDLFRTMKEEDWTPEHVSAQIDNYLNDLPARDEFIYKKANTKTGVKVGDVKQKDVDAQKEKMELLRATAKLFPKYCEMMKERSRYDYSDMILWVLNAFKKDKNFLSTYQEWYQYFLIDEYQDTSGAQNQLLQLLIDYWEKPNVFVVGDDDQCIYEFQGARVKNMTQFVERYPDIEVVVLKENYRSTQKILDASKAVIDNNVQRLVNQAPLLKKIPNLTKDLISNTPAPKGDNISPSLIQYYNIQHEEASIVEEISNLMSPIQGVRGQDIAILYFKHAQATNIIELLEKKEIPYNVKKKIDILNLIIIQQLLNIFSYLKEEHDKPHSGEHLLFEVMHYSFFNINPKDIAKISVHCGKNHLRWRDFLAQYEELKKLNLENYGSVIFFEENLTRWITEVSNSTLQMLFEKVLNWSGLLKHILDSPDKVWLLQVITTLFDFIKSECAKHPMLSIKQFLEMIQQMREAQISISINKTVYEENGVNLITAHSAKGLEFRYVYLIGCTTDNWEKSRGIMNKFSLPDTLTFTQKDDENKLESARRLFYVGMTRAKEHLQISFAESSNTGKALEHSIYIEEIKAKTDLVIEKRHLSTEKISEYTALALRESKPLNAEVLDKEYMKSIFEKFEMTATHLNKYLQCPLTFYYESVLRVPFAKNEYTAFGTVVHNVLKWLFDEMKSRRGTFPSADEFISEFKKQMKRQRDAFTEQEFTNRIAYGEQIMPDYYNKYVSIWNKNVKTEYTINNIEIDGVPVNGNLDKIEFIENNECNVVDYKTGKPENGLKKINPPSAETQDLAFLHGGDYWRQIVFYKILIDNFKRENWKMLSGEIDFIEKHTTKKDFVKAKIMVTKEDVAIVKKQIKEVYTKIMNHEFTQGCGEEDCKWCNFVNVNQTTSSLFETE
ncbi:MAG: ATP-dependent helicase [Bacteroidetes bacterium]|nr:ATP-dependent helicase [Bacteroidota bacterium]